MKLHQNQREALLYALPAILTRAMAFILLPIYSRVLLPSEFGLVSIALIFSGIAQIVVLPGIEGLYLRYGYQGYSTDKKESTWIGTIARCHLFLAFFAIPIFGAFASKFSEYFSPEVPSHFIWLALLNLSVESLQAPTFARYKATRAVKKLARFELAQLIVNASLILLALFVFKLGPLSLLLGNFIGATLLLPVTLREIGSAFKKSSWSKEAFSVVGKSFLTVGPEAFFYWALTALDRYLLNLIRGTRETGIYVASYQFGSMLISLSSVGARQWKVLLYQTYVDKINSTHQLKSLYRETAFLFFLGASFIAVLADPIVDILLGKNFDEAHTVIPIIMLLVCLRVPMTYFSMYCWANQYRRIAVKLNALAFFILVTSLSFLVPSFGMKGAAWAGVLACVPFGAAFQFLRVKEFSLDRAFLKPPFFLALLGLAVALTVEGFSGIKTVMGFVLLFFLLLQAKNYFAALSFSDQELK